MKEKFLFTIQKVEVGKLNALVNNIMKQTGINDPEEAIRLVNSGEWVLSESTSSWDEEDGIIRFSVISDGTTGGEWINRFENKGIGVDNKTKQVLLSKNFKPTIGVIYNIAVLKGGIIKNTKNRNIKNILLEAEKLRFSNTNYEAACLIRNKFFNKDFRSMEVRTMVVMHEPIKKPDMDPALLSVWENIEGSFNNNSNSSLLSLRSYYIGKSWDIYDGFAFIDSSIRSN